MAAKPPTTENPEPNWAAMFLAYSQGSPLEEIGQTFGVPLTKLRKIAADQNWAGLTVRSQESLGTPALRNTELEVRLEVLENNRKANLELAVILRERLLHDLNALKNGTLRVERAIASKGEIHHIEVAAGPSDILALSKAVETVANTTYRALGDVQATSDRGQEGSKNAAGVTVIMPTVIHAGNPNFEMPPDRRGNVIDLQEIPVSLDSVPIQPTKSPAKPRVLVESPATNP